MSGTSEGQSHRRDLVPVEPFRRRFLELQMRGVTYADIARELGWFDEHGYAYGGRVNRVLGLRLSRSSWGKGAYEQKYVSIETAKALCEIMGMSYQEVGL